ncbi:MAG: hypothetical protein RBR19_19665 [Sedimentisphaerales bacterium]|nr:hypothetical protein [Sedimentisphaerales bacterium]NLT78270.1 hypothetical protein [Planctomycetota bacterium]
MTRTRAKQKYIAAVLELRKATRQLSVAEKKLTQAEENYFQSPSPSTAKRGQRKEAAPT